MISKRGLWEENVALWEHNADRLRDKLIADARQHAVPTADVDARARARKIAALEQAGLFGLSLVSMFVPVLGEVMLGVMAGQLLYETFDGAIEWSEGDREAAVGHITDVAENLAQMALMAGGGAVLGRVLRPPPVIENLKPVTLPSGEQKLWKNDLTPYKANVELPPTRDPMNWACITMKARRCCRWKASIMRCSTTRIMASTVSSIPRGRTPMRRGLSTTKRAPGTTKVKHR